MKRNPAVLFPWQRLPHADAQPLKPLTEDQRHKIGKTLGSTQAEQGISDGLAERIAHAIRRYRAFRERRGAQPIPTDQKETLKAARRRCKRLQGSLATFDVETEKRIISSLGKTLGKNKSTLLKFDYGEKRLFALRMELLSLDEAINDALSRTRTGTKGRKKLADVYTTSGFLIEIWEKHTGKVASKDKKRRVQLLDFLRAVFHIADESVTVADEINALRWVLRKRQKNVDEDGPEPEPSSDESDEEDAIIHMRRRPKK
jgi:hypothetical protein